MNSFPGRFSVSTHLEQHLSDHQCKNFRLLFLNKFTDPVLHLDVRIFGFVDLDENKRSDYIDTLEYLDKKEARDSKMKLDEKKETNKILSDKEKNDIKRKELDTKIKHVQTQLPQITEENALRILVRTQLGRKREAKVD